MKIVDYLEKKREAVGLTETEEKIYFCLASVDPSLCLRSGSVPIDGASTDLQRRNNGPATEEGV